MRGFVRIRRTQVLAIPIVLGFLGCNQNRIDFSSEVKPIINKRCISCHGGVKRNGGFSLLFRMDALDTVESGKLAIIPGDPQHSEMIRRLTSKDPEERMPYKEEPLIQEEIRILTQWIEQGAEWGDHWAYVPPKPTELPSSSTLLSGFSSDTEWVKNEIDYFILDKLEDEKLNPSPEADKATLIRRIYFDLIGLPPTPEQAEKFLNDESPEAYEKVIDELLASPHFGEKWAAWWMDLARYSDTKGYESDLSRTIWRYRDWVIKAFNSDKPFDQFTIEQLAGDLLPNPTDDQFIATGFHRNTMNNDEGGTDDEEFRVAALIDRVSTTWEVWQSTTMGCVQCHTHPYDPFVHEEYYKSLAFFNNTRDEDTYGEHPNLRIYKKEEDQRKLEAIKTWVREHGSAEKEMEATRFLKTFEPKTHAHDFDQFINGELAGYNSLGVRSGGSARLKQVNLRDKTHLIFTYYAGEVGGSFEVRRDKLDGEVIAKTSVKKVANKTTIAIPLKPSPGTHDLYFVFSNPKINPQTPVCEIDWFAFRDDLPGKNKTGYDATAKSFTELLNADVDNTPIMAESTSEQYRKTRVFERGNWLVKGKVVKPEVPRLLNPFPENAPSNRLGFAMWMVSKDNPLTSRTIVNRLWEQIFGYGIVETLEDFGTQGAAPSHPELLDWLSLRLMNDHHWSMKKLLKDFVMSATYRQDSRVTNELLERDQRNSLLARGPRVRLTAEQVRDQALAVSGLLSKKMYGKSVMPYQPEGIWNSVWSGEYWKTSEGEDQYRRSLYTFIKRTSPYPSMMMFDGSSREVCISRRIRTNTPLQALVTMNDSTYVVAARNFARRMRSEAKAPADQIRAGYKILVMRSIPENKLSVLNKLYDDALIAYTADEKASEKLTAEKKTLPEFAAMTIVANAMLNLDEVLTKE